MIIGLDFDNTIACYDRAIERLANELFTLPPSVKKTKTGLRDYLRAEGREPEWTEFQGRLYGPGMNYAEPYPGALAAIASAKAAGHRVVIISHKTKYPYLGPKYDLHASARAWIGNQLRQDGRSLFAEDSVFLNETLDEKISVIAKAGCDVFLDDLLEVLDHRAFPATTKKLWFSERDAPAGSSVTPVKHWDGLACHLAP